MLVCQRGVVVTGRRQRLGLIFGGRSLEHEVSVVSAQHVIAAADRERFEVVPIGVTKAGAWLTTSATETALARPEAPFQKRLVAPHEGPGGLAEALRTLQSLDVVFPLIHGTHGEDGTLQGMLELANVPYVGCGVAASAIGMDKALMKAVYAAAGIPVGDYAVVEDLRHGDEALAMARDLEGMLSYPMFVKPANGGSSVGVSKVRGREELAGAMLDAMQYDRKLVIEKNVEGREVECAVLGNRDAQASPVGEIRHQRDFYDYEAKYLDPATQVLAPADLAPDVVERVQALALQAFHAIDGSGLSRVDFFLLSDGSLIIDEINTMPGFTPASMYPRLWQAIDVSYGELITRLVDFALARHREKRIA